MTAKDGQKKLAKLQRFWGKIFSHGLGRARAIYGTYFPDSVFIFRQHEEFDLLFEKFTFNNRKNNGGDIPRLLSLMLNVKSLLGERAVPGHLAEVGVWRGNTAAVLAHYAKKFARRLYLFDTFSGFDNRDLTGIDGEKATYFADTSVQAVKALLDGVAGNVEFVTGRFPESVRPEIKAERFSVVSVDCDLYEPTKAALNFFFERLNPGGMMFLHDYANPSWSGVRAAVDEFCRDNRLGIVLLPDKSGTAILAKSP